jgi:spore coat polysaccharide biosynthesis predicted glycosyltransferase SpsG
MSTLDKGYQFDTQDALKALTEIIRDFYTDEHLDQKTDLTMFQVVGLTKVEYLDDLIFEEFGYNSKLTEKVKTRLERKMVSFKRTGRTEAMQTISMQLTQIMMHPQTALKRLFGME